MRISDWSSDVCSSDLLPPGVPLLKRVLGLPGQKVCRVGRTITVDRVAMGQARETDRLGRAMPDWQGCRRIADGEVFLMNWSVPDSLAGRYFGPLPASSLIGRARSDEHTSELQSLMRISYAVFCLKK